MSFIQVCRQRLVRFFSLAASSLTWKSSYLKLPNTWWSHSPTIVTPNWTVMHTLVPSQKLWIQPVKFTSPVSSLTRPAEGVHPSNIYIHRHLFTWRQLYNRWWLQISGGFATKRKTTTTIPREVRRPGRLISKKWTGGALGAQLSMDRWLHICRRRLLWSVVYVPAVMPSTKDNYYCL